MQSDSDSLALFPLQCEAVPRVKPFLKWAGGKSKLIGELIPRLPSSYERYVEPMIGGGALFFAVQPKKSLIVDVNPELVNLYKTVQKDVEELITDLSRHRYDEEYFYMVRAADRDADFFDLSPVERASRTIFLNKTCYNGLYRVNAHGHFNVPFGRYSNPTIVAPDTLRACSKALKGAKILCSSFDRLLKHLKKGDFIYFDPPYVPVTKTSSFASYARDGFTLEDQIRLRDLCIELDKRGFKFMLSNSYTDVVLELYDRFNVETVEAPRAINSKALGRGKVREVVVRNYE